MFRFRIYVWTTRGFRTRPDYTEAPSAAAVRRRLVKQIGARAAMRSSVTAICDVTPGLNPDLAFAAWRQGDAVQS